jgi:hypothetical protein
MGGKQDMSAVTGCDPACVAGRCKDKRAEQGKTVR